MSWSVATELAAARPSAVTPGPPPEPAPVPPSRRWIWWLVAAVVAVGSLTWAIARSARSTADPATERIRTATVIKGEFVRTLRVTGTTEAMQSYVVSAPTLTGGGLGSLVITHLATPGQKVKKGDLLVEFDRQNQIKNALDSEATYKDLVEQIKKKQAAQAIARAKDDSELQQARDAVQSAELETRRNEVVSRIDAEKNIANLEEARARYQQLQQTYQLKRQADAADLKVLEIQRDRAHSSMLHSQSNAARMEIRSPIDGVVVLNSTWKGNQMGEVQEGDEVRPGVPFLQVMDPGAIQVRARVNQEDLPWLDVGQTVFIRPDAYPGLSLPGRLERLAAIGVTSGLSSRVRTFVAIFTIDPSQAPSAPGAGSARDAAQDARLMPDLSAAIDIVLQRRGDSLIIPRDALYLDAGGAYVWVQRGQTFEREAVKLGPVADEQAVVLSGLRQGDVVLRNPRKLPPGEKQS